MLNLVRSIKVDEVSGDRLKELIHDEWLVTNGLGGYASGTICGNVTRRYHGLLIAALPVPLGRVVMLNHMAEFLQVPGGKWIQIGGEETGSTVDSFETLNSLKEFRLEN